MEGGREGWIRWNNEWKHMYKEEGGREDEFGGKDFESKGGKNEWKS